MNPFDKYRSCRLNDLLITKETIDAELIAQAKSKNLYEALLFLQELYSDSEQVQVKTSGSTGSPKELSFPKSAFEISAQATNQYFNLGPNSASALYLPMQFIAAKMMVVRALVGNYQLIVHEPSSSPEVADEIDFIPLTPHQMRYVLESNQKPKAKILLGGSPVSKSMIEEILQKGLEVYASFGMTETLSHIALCRIDNSSKKGIVYHALNGVKTGIDERGCLSIDWKGITDGKLRTNDLIEQADQGFKWLGRSDNLINSGGVKVIPERVEELLQKQMNRPFFVYGMPHQVLGEEVTLFVEGSDKVVLSEVPWDFPQQKPRNIIGFESFARTSSGKIQRKKTAAQIG